ncbi:MAG: TatD family hydrolase [Endomicrobium sp.]|nr:TatD family hydrolase [Endomicrobium sp.]
MIIDTHVHLSDIVFDKDRDFVVDKMYKLKISSFFEIACEICYWDKAVEISKKYNAFLSFGIHPTNINNATKNDYIKLESLILKNKKCIAVGEIGLDYHYKNTDSYNQKKNFVKQLEIAFKHNKPVIIHCRDAYDDLIDILKHYSKIKGVVHCFSGTINQAEMLLNFGLLLGICGPITYKNTDILKKIVVDTSINNLLIETDSPYLPTQNCRGRRNEPSNIVKIVEKISELKKIKFDEVAENTKKNAIKLFNIFNNTESGT